MVFFVVIRIILVELADSGSHVEEARVEEHEQITRHAGADQGVLVTSSAVLGDYDEDTHNTVQVRYSRSKTQILVPSSRSFHGTDS